MKLNEAIRSFIDREYPTVGQQGLTIVPSFPSVEGDITWEDVSLHCIKEKQGGIIYEMEDMETENMDSDKKKIVCELIKKFRGEEGERLAILPIIKWLAEKGADGRDATVILSQKSTLELVEKTMEQILMDDSFNDLIDKKMYTVEKVAEAVGIDLQISSIEEDVNNIMVEFFGKTGAQSTAEMKEALDNYTAPQGMNKFKREKYKKNRSMLLEILYAEESLEMNMFKKLKHHEMRKKLNMNKKEHDIVFLKPHHKTIGHFEVKAMVDQQNGEVRKALSQLKGGKEEMARAHGHTLDEHWRYLGVICLPKLRTHLKEKICKDLKICDHCAGYILVENDSFDSLLESCFDPNNVYPDEAVWRKQYKAIASRLLAFEHLTPPVTVVKRITGREKEVVPGFIEEADLMIDPVTASPQQLEDWKKENHLGSPTSILFLSKEQQLLRNIRRVLLLADYSTG